MWIIRIRKSRETMGTTKNRIFVKGMLSTNFGADFFRMDGTDANGGSFGEFVPANNL